MNWLLTGEIIGGILGYLIVIMGLCYLHGRFVDKYQLEGHEIAMILFWPITLVAGIPIGAGFGFFWGMVTFADYIRELGHAKLNARLEAERRLRTINLFEGDNDAL